MPGMLLSYCVKEKLDINLLSQEPKLLHSTFNNIMTTFSSTVVQKVRLCELTPSEVILQILHDESGVGENLDAILQSWHRTVGVESEVIRMVLLRCLQLQNRRLEVKTLLQQSKQGLKGHIHEVRVFS